MAKNIADNSASSVFLKVIYFFSSPEVVVKSLVIILALILAFGCSESPEAKKEKTRIQIWKFATSKVAERLEVPSSVNFYDYKGKDEIAAKVSELAPTVYVVTGHVESKNKSGAAIFNEFIVSIDYDTVTQTPKLGDVNPVLIDGVAKH